MTARRGSLPPRYFAALYARRPDPWRFRTSRYESAKYRATLRALPPRQFESALEVGCSVGVLTRMLAARCAALLAIDVAEAALAQARRRCAGLAQVRLERRRVPQEWPERRFDLILLSEILYYLDRNDLLCTAARARATAAPGGAVLLVHYTRPTNYPASGDGAAEAFIAASGFIRVRQLRAPGYRLDLLRA